MFLEIFRRALGGAMSTPRLEVVGEDAVAIETVTFYPHRDFLLAARILDYRGPQAALPKFQRLAGFVEAYPDCAFGLLYLESDGRCRWRAGWGDGAVEGVADLAAEAAMACVAHWEQLLQHARDEVAVCQTAAERFSQMDGGSYAIPA